MTDLHDQMARFARMSVERGAYDLGAPQFDTNPEPLLPALEAAGCGLVAELRVAEPRMGRIPKDMDAARRVREMLRRGAAAVGVMTEQMKFGGSLDLVGMARQGAPVVVRDFVVDPVQVQAAHHAGASAIVLDAVFETGGHADLGELLGAVDDWDLEAIVQVRSLDDVEMAEDRGAAILGPVLQDPVTRTRHDDLAEAVLADAQLPVVLMGGIRSADDFARARELGAVGAWVDGPLVGHDTPWEVVEAIARGNA